ncbi:MAG: heavy metal-associated domain-containing protein, partial [Ginsengibacter sp.]
MATDNNIPIEIPLEKLDSQDSALVVDNGLEKVKGVNARRVELNNHKAVIEAGDSETVTEAVTTIHDLGNNVNTIKKIFPVTGLSCASCAVSVESVLKSEPGVINAGVNFANSNATIEYISGVADVKHFKQSIQEIGY